MLYLILHKVRGEATFDIASQLDGLDIWIIPTSGHRAYPFRKWPLEDLADISDINLEGFHDRPASFDHTLPPDWPDHYATAAEPRPKAAAPAISATPTIEDLLI